MKATSQDPDVLGGELVFAGTRVPVRSLLDHLEGGDSIGNFLEGFPSVRREQVMAVLEDAEDLAVVERRSGEPTLAHEEVFAAFKQSQMKEELITYTVEVEGDTYVVEDVPARVDVKTGEPFFTPDTVDRLQEILEKQMAEREHDEWVEFSMQNFARAYGDDEPDYSLEDIKESEDDPPTNRRDE